MCEKSVEKRVSRQRAFEDLFARRGDDGETVMRRAVQHFGDETDAFDFAECLKVE